MNLSKSFGNEFVDGVLEAAPTLTPDRSIDNRPDGPARFRADPPPGHDGVAA